MRKYDWEALQTDWLVVLMVMPIAMEMSQVL